MKRKEKKRREKKGTDFRTLNFECNNQYIICTYTPHTLTYSGKLLARIH
jgi:hypothetical protein